MNELKTISCFRSTEENRIIFSMIQIKYLVIWNPLLSAFERIDQSKIILYRSNP